jgi:O-antigen ligase
MFADNTLLRAGAVENRMGAPPRALPVGVTGKERSYRFCLRLADLVSIEASFLLFLFAGRYKNLPELRGFPIDFTLLFFTTTLALIAWAIVAGRLRPFPLSPGILSMIAFCALATASLFWSSIDDLNIDKMVRFLFLTSPSFFAAYMFAQDKQRKERLLRLLVWFSCAILLYYGYYRCILGIDVAADAETDGYADNYLEYSSHASIIFIIFLCLAAYGSPKQLGIAIIGSSAALFALVAIGGRGPLTLALLAIPLLALGLLSRSVSLQRLKRLILFVSALIVIGGVGYGGFVQLSEPNAVWEQLHTLDRYQAQLSGEETHSVDLRIDGQEDAYRRWLEKPLLGWGFGEFRVQHNDLAYPHNLLLEILMEIGLAGAFFFVCMCAVAVIECVRLVQDRNANWINSGIALLFLTDLVSHLTVEGYLADDRAFFAYLGLVLGLSRAAERRGIQPLPRHPTRDFP